MEKEEKRMPKRKSKDPKAIPPLQQGAKIEKIITLNRNSIHLTIIVSGIIGKTIFWDVKSAEKVFTEFQVRTDEKNVIRLYETITQKNLIYKKNRASGILSEAIKLIVNELQVRNPTKAPAFFLRAVNHYLYTEFISAGFVKDRNLHDTTLIYNW